MTNNTVVCATTHKLLGIIISNDLQWNKHIDYISKKASKRPYSLKILKKVSVNRLGIVKVYLTTICRDCFFWSFVTFVIDNLVLKSCEPQFKLRTLREIRLVTF